MTLFAWPKQAAFGRVVPKSKIYEHAGVSSTLKERFVQQVEQINWAFKLAPETVNLPATRAVAEIQVFRITLKRESVDQEVLKAIDRAIPFPLIFELIHGERTKLVAAYKRLTQSPKGEEDHNRWVVGNYFEAGWQPQGGPREPLPVALDMAGLYEHLLNPLVQWELAVATADAKKAVPLVRESDAAAPAVTTAAGRHDQLTLEQGIVLAEAIAAQQRQVERIKTKLDREEQFNKRVAINAELRDAKQKLRRLTQR